MTPLPDREALAKKMYELDLASYPNSDPSWEALDQKTRDYWIKHQSGPALAALAALSTPADAPVIEAGEVLLAGDTGMESDGGLVALHPDYEDTYMDRDEIGQQVIEAVVTPGRYRVQLIPLPAREEG